MKTEDFIFASSKCCFSGRRYSTRSILGVYHFKRIHQSGRDFTHFQNKTPSPVLNRCPQVESRKIKKASWARLILVVVVVKSGSKIERPAKFKGVCATFCLCPGKKKRWNETNFCKLFPPGNNKKKVLFNLVRWLVLQFQVASRCEMIIPISKTGKKGFKKLIFVRINLTCTW